MNPKVDFYFNKAKKWQEEIKKLRMILLDCQLAEVLKWGCPCYMYGKSNIVLIHIFKEYCALLFFKGALLKDKHGILIQQTENVQSARQVRFTNVRQIVELENILKEYVFEAVEVEETGIRVLSPVLDKQAAENKFPEELKKKLAEIPGLKTAFEALTPGRQRGYVLHFSAPKQSKTRDARIEKHVHKILDGKGLND